MKVSALHLNVLLFVINTVPEQMDYMAVTSCFVFRRFWEFSLNAYVCHFIVNTVVQWLSCVWVSGTPWIVAHQASLFFTISQSLLKYMSIELLMPSKSSHPLWLLVFLPSVFPSIRVFSIESSFHIRWPKYWSFSFSITPSNEYSRLISFSIDWFDLLAVQGTLKSLLQHCSSKASISQFSVSLWSSSHIHTDYWENHSFD